MFGVRKEQQHTLFLSDTILRFLSLEYVKGKPRILHVHEEKLPLGIIVNGEVMRVEALRQLLMKLKKKFSSVKSIHLLLPFNRFSFHALEIAKGDRELSKKKKIKNTLASLAEQPAWIQEYAHEVSVYSSVAAEYLLFECLPPALFRAYEHVCEAVGFRIHELHADMQSLAKHLGEQHHHIVLVEAHRISLAYVDRAIIRSIQSFSFSEEQFVSVVAKYAGLNKEAAQEAFNRYGFLRSHKSEQVYRKLIELFSPLFFALNHKKYITDVHIIFTEKPYLGFVDMFKKQTKHRIHEYDYITQHLQLEDTVLPFHRDESYGYQALIAEGLKQKAR